MRETSYRYVVNALGKGGQIYLTQCQDKNDLKKWLANHEHELVNDEVKIVDKKRHPLFRLFSIKR